MEGTRGTGSFPGPWLCCPVPGGAGASSQEARRLCPTQAVLVQSSTCTVSSLVRAWPGVNECVCVCVCVCTHVAFLDQGMLRRSC